jgi:uncharacterized YigZ family protein
MQADHYQGIDQIYTSEYKTSGSRFIGFLFPCDDPHSFEKSIKSYKEKFADATHICSACVIGVEREYQRCSDDGEPSNSSGRPILNTLLSKGITNLGCAVVRYYGGKKLGIPGLIEAYGGAAQLCIDQAEVINKTLEDSIVCSISDDISYKLYNFLAKRTDLSYAISDSGQFVLTCAKNLTPSLRTELKKIPNLVVE